MIFRIPFPRRQRSRADKLKRGIQKLWHAVEPGRLADVLPGNFNGRRGNSRVEGVVGRLRRL